MISNKFSRIIKLNLYLLTFLSFLLAFIPIQILSYRHATNEFLYQHIAYSNILAKEGHLLYIPKMEFVFSLIDTIPGYYVILTILNIISNIPLKVIQFLPIGWMLFIVIYGLVIRNNTKSMILLSTAILYISFDASQMPGIYSVFPYAFAFPLFLIGAYSLTYKLSNQNLNFFVSLLVMFTALTLYHYTPSFWLILFAILLGVINVFSKTKGYKHVFGFFLLSLILYLSLNKVFYTMYLPPILNENKDLGQQAVEMFFSKITLGAKSTKIEKYLYVTTTNKVLDILRISNIGLLLLTSTICIMEIFYKIAKNSKILNKNEKLIFVLYFVGIADTTLYGLRGNISTKFISIFFPIIVIYYVSIKLNQHHNREIVKKIYKVIILGLLIIVSTKFLLFLYNGPLQENTPYEKIHNGAEWFFTHSISHNRDIPYILADLHTYGKLLVIGSEKNKLIMIRYYTGEIYDLVVNPVYVTRPNKLSAICDYIIIDKLLSYPTKSYWWREYEPLKRHTSEIKLNSNINILYEDNVVIIGECH